MHQECTILKRPFCFKAGSVQHLEMSWDTFLKHRTAQGLERIHNRDPTGENGHHTNLLIRCSIGYQNLRQETLQEILCTKSESITFKHDHIRKGSPLISFALVQSRDIKSLGKWKKHTILHLYKLRNMATNLPLGLRALRSAKRPAKAMEGSRHPTHEIMARRFKRKSGRHSHRIMRMVQTSIPGKHSTAMYSIPSANLLPIEQPPIEIIDIYPLKMVIFHSYVSLPKGNEQQIWCWTSCVFQGFGVDPSCLSLLFRQLMSWWRWNFVSQLTHVLQTVWDTAGLLLGNSWSMLKYVEVCWSDENIQISNMFQLFNTFHVRPWPTC